MARSLPNETRPSEPSTEIRKHHGPTQAYSSNGVDLFYSVCEMPRRGFEKVERLPQSSRVDLRGVEKKDKIQSVDVVNGLACNAF